MTAVCIIISQAAPAAPLRLDYKVFNRFIAGFPSYVPSRGAQAGATDGL